MCIVGKLHFYSSDIGTTSIDVHIMTSTQPISEKKAKFNVFFVTFLKIDQLFNLLVDFASQLSNL